MSDTPRTDAIQETFNQRDGMCVDDIVEAYEHARTLERENAALRELVIDCQADLAAWIVPDSGISECTVIGQLLQRLDGPQARAALGKEESK